MDVPAVELEGQNDRYGYPRAKDLKNRQLPVTADEQEKIYLVSTYRSNNHQPVVPVCLAHDADPDIEAQAKAQESDWKGDELDDHQGRPASLGVDIVRLRPCGQDFRRWESHDDGC